MSKRLLLAAIIPFFALTSCKNIDEQDDLAKAQKCLDEVTVPNEADACLSYIEKYTSQQANILKCSIHMVSGGLMESRMVKAYQVLEDDSITNKELAFMSILALDSPATTGLTKAQTAYDFCMATGLPGLQYLAGVILNGTVLAKSLANFGGITENSTPAQIQAALNSMVTDCTGAAPSGSCPTDADLQIIGSSVATMATGYCANENADEEICKDVNDALAAAGNNATYLGQALLCYANNKTFNPATGECNP